MVNTLITHFQIFAIGFSFGIAGPCFFLCTPILITYIAGRGEEAGRTLIEISVFLAGRISAYALLGAIAGFSGALFRGAAGSALGRVLGALGGVVSIALGLVVLLNRGQGRCGCRMPSARILGFGSLFTLGFIIGVSPCAPLAALLVEIALMSRGAADGALYAFSFGMGTLISGVLVIGALAGILKGAAARLVRSRAGNMAFRALCGAMLAAFGIGMIVKAIVTG